MKLDIDLYWSTPVVELCFYILCTKKRKRPSLIVVPLETPHRVKLTVDDRPALFPRHANTCGFMFLPAQIAQRVFFALRTMKTSKRAEPQTKGKHLSGEIAVGIECIIGMHSGLFGRVATRLQGELFWEKTLTRRNESIFSNTSRNLFKHAE